jgi:1-deoxy-D-xylulose-5-phosphate reductoisomerase
VVVLGSTGSIGQSTLQVIEHLQQLSRDVKVVGLAAGTNDRLLIQQARQHGVKDLAVADPRAAVAVREAFPEADVRTGPDAARQLVEACDADAVVAGIVGIAGLPATWAAVQRGLRVCLANKETLVAIGSLVMPLARRTGALLLPVDSEHAAVWQCLGRPAVPWPPHPAISPLHHVAKVTLTASGGPFRQATAEQIASATPEQALDHPTWQMGPKVTIDSATLMNKALELIEAHHLFGLPPEQLDAMVHPQSSVHAMVHTRDGQTLAQLGPADMRVPIQAALTWPDVVPAADHQAGADGLPRLDFEPVDHERFPGLSLAWRAMRDGGTAGATLNAANEVAVEAFLAGRVRLPEIPRLIERVMDALPAARMDNLDSVMAADGDARRSAEQQLAKPVGG